MNRPIYRECAASLLARCRALPLQRFSAINDLSLAQLRRAVNKAARWEQAWRTRGPRPIPSSSASTDSTDLYENEHSNYMDNFMPLLPDDPQWYRIVDSPTGEIIDWLSPITNSYVLCSTKSGKVGALNISDACTERTSYSTQVILSSLTNSTPDNKPIATWCPKGRKWELWKCRVEFEEQSVYFCMAREIKDKSGLVSLISLLLISSCYAVKALTMEIGQWNSRSSSCRFPQAQMLLLRPVVNCHFQATLNLSSRH